MGAINGKPLREVMAELNRYESKAGNKMRYSCYTYEQFKNRMDQVLGYNYHEDYSEVQLINVGEQPELVMKCTISIYDDEGKLVVSKSGIGGIEYQRNNENGRFIELSNNNLIAMYNAFKNACKMLGVLGVYDEEKPDEEKPKATSNNYSNNSSSNNNSGKEGVGTFIAREKMKAFGDGNYQLYIFPVVNGKVTTDKKKVVFYKNSQRPDLVEQLRSRLELGEPVTINNMKFSTLPSGDLRYVAFSKPNSL